jgi:patatin-like phospholipase/acyl hydrolase
MKDLFDMFAGTSTGSILASALSLANDDPLTDPRQPMFWADAIEKIYVSKRD